MRPQTSRDQTTVQHLVGLVSAVLVLVAVAASPASAIDGSETVEVLAGTGDSGYSGDGRAVNTDLLGPRALTVGPDGSLYFIDSGSTETAIRVVRDGGVSTIFGNGTTESSGNGGPASSAGGRPLGLAFGPDELLYFTDRDSNTIRYIDTDGKAQLFAGNGIDTSAGDGKDRREASFNYPDGLAFGPDGSLYVTEWEASLIRRISPTGLVSTVAGTGDADFSGDGGPATQADLNGPIGIVVDQSGNLIFADSGNNRVRMVSAAGTITTIAGTGGAAFSGLGGPATGAAIGDVTGVALDGEGLVYLITSGTGGQTALDLAGKAGEHLGRLRNPSYRVLRVERNGSLNSVMGQEGFVSGSYGEPASQTAVSWASGLAIGRFGDLYVADFKPGRILVALAPTCRRGPAADEWDTTNPIRASLYRLYCAYFLRFPDHSGYDYWHGEVVGHKTSLTGISDVFATSVEFDQTYGALSNGEFLDLLYGNIMGRSPDPAGRSYWLGILDTGVLTKGGVVLQFSDSAEFRRQTGTP